MDIYNHYRYCSDVNNIIDNINDMLLPPTMYPACHGKNHALFVVDKTDYILKSLSYDPRIVELGKIAALLHDIGNIAGRWNHALKSAALTTVLMEYPVHLLPDEKAMIIQAVKDHSNGDNIASAIGAALLIADKIDITKKRILPDKILDAWHKNLLEIDDVDICVSDKSITINYITTELFSKELLVSEYAKGFNLPIKAAKYLGCDCHFQFNGIEADLV